MLEFILKDFVSISDMHRAASLSPESLATQRFDEEPSIMREEAPDFLQLRQFQRFILPFSLSMLDGLEDSADTNEAEGNDQSSNDDSVKGSDLDMGELREPYGAEQSCNAAAVSGLDPSALDGMCRLLLPCAL